MTKLHDGSGHTQRPGFRSRSLLAAAALALGGTMLLQATDWPQYRGPTHDGKSSEKIPRNWPAEGLKAVWKVPTPNGFGVFSVSHGRAFTLVSREVEGTQREILLALDAKSGKELWAYPLGLAKYDGGGDSGEEDNKGGDGPRSTPAADGDKVYALDAHLLLACVEADSGKTVWSKDLIKDFGAKNIGWQNAASPLIEGDLLYLCCGAPDGSLMALDKKTGTPVWKGESDQMTHSSPLAATILGVRQVVFFTQKGLVSADAKSGKVLWRYGFPYKVSTAASPVVSGDIVYCSAGYGVGSGAVKIAKAGDEFTATELWRESDAKNHLMNHWSTPIVKDGYLYGMFGFKEYGKGALKCVAIATGKEMWTEANFGPAGVLLAGDILLALNDRGQLVMVEASPTACKELGRSPAVAGKCWNHPVLSDGRIYVRSTKEGACLELSLTAAKK